MFFAVLNVRCTGNIRDHNTPSILQAAQWLLQGILWAHAPVGCKLKNFWRVERGGGCKLWVELLVKWKSGRSASVIRNDSLTSACLFLQVHGIWKLDQTGAQHHLIQCPQFLCALHLWWTISLHSHCCSSACWHTTYSFCCSGWA